MFDWAAFQGYINEIRNFGKDGYGYLVPAVATVAAVGSAANDLLMAVGVGEGISALRAATTGTAAAAKLGQAGEAAVRAAADIGEKTAIRVGGRLLRFPDGINLAEGTLSEVKNVASQSFTRQLNDYLGYARENNLRFDLWIREGTQETVETASGGCQGRVDQPPDHSSMKKTREPRITAKDLLGKLQADPEWVAKRERNRNKCGKGAPAELHAVEAPLVTALRGAGILVTSVWDLVNTSEGYPDAIPVLLTHLGRPYPDEIGAGIARALAVDDARPHSRTIVAEYEAADASIMPKKKDALACAVAKTADVSDVIRLIVNPAHGDSRLLLLLALRRSEDTESGGNLAGIGARSALLEGDRVLAAARALSVVGESGFTSGRRAFWCSSWSTRGCACRGSTGRFVASRTAGRRTGFSTSWSPVVLRRRTWRRPRTRGGSTTSSTSRGTGCWASRITGTGRR